MTEPQRIERICLLELEARDLVSELDGGLVEVVVAFEVCAEAPIVKEVGFDHEGRERGGLRTQELDKPIGEDVRIGLDGDNGVGEERVDEYFLVVSSKRTGRVLSALEIFDEGGLYGLSINCMDDEVWEATVVGLVALGAFSESDEAGERGGVVACS